MKKNGMRIQLIQQRGFTIVELMIATLVFALILTVITLGVISFTNRYYKGVNASTTQGVAQDIVDTISQAVQFGASSVTIPAPPNSGYFCAGGYVFTYNTAGTMFTGDTVTQTGFYVAPMGATCAALTSGGRQLLGKNMRITSRPILSNVSANVYQVSLSIAYGDNDLLCAPSVSASCAPSAATLTNGQLSNAPDVTCKATVGSQFCAVSRLTTSIEKRIAN